MGLFVHRANCPDDARHAGQTFVGPVLSQSLRERGGIGLRHDGANHSIGPGIMWAFVAVVLLASLAGECQKIAPRGRKELSAEECTGDLRLPDRVDHHAEPLPPNSAQSA
jgi:hypothetical protein